jgi:hypothetical protein
LGGVGPRDKRVLDAAARILALAAEPNNGAAFGMVVLRLRRNALTSGRRGALASRAWMELPSRWAEPTRRVSGEVKTEVEMRVESTREWKVRQRAPRDACRCDFPAWLSRQSVQRAERDECLGMWAALPRRGGHTIIPNLKPLGGEPDSDLESSPLFVKFLLMWIAFLKTQEYVVQVFNGTDTTIAVVWTYLYNELTPGNDIITVGPTSSTWFGLLPEETAEFSFYGCLYMKSYAITVVYEGTPDVVLPNTSIGEINAYEQSEYGVIDFCGDWWEIYVR